MTGKGGIEWVSEPRKWCSSCKSEDFAQACLHLCVSAGEIGGEPLERRPEEEGIKTNRD
jgi:hypothetical protein